MAGPSASNALASSMTAWSGVTLVAIGVLLLAVGSVSAIKSGFQTMPNLMWVGAGLVVCGFALGLFSFWWYKPDGNEINY